MVTPQRLWKYIEFSDEWKNCDTSLLDEIADSWFARREILQANSQEYQDFINRLKRQHAIETGVVERMYDISKGVTETLINEGFISSLVSHGDTNIPTENLFKHLQDHLEAVDFIFDIVKQNRPLTKSFICELHQLTTRHQDHTEGIDQFGRRIKIALIKGRFKERENNPVREDGTKILYCPPEHVEAEMDRLIQIYNEVSGQNINPLIIATWFHHAFTMIHPFQDGNGRVVRLIASLILVKNRFFPITVLREEAKEKYLKALEEADEGKPQALVTYFAEIQKRNIEEALNIREVSSNNSLDTVTNILKQKILKKQQEQQQQYEQMLADNRRKVFDYCSRFLDEYRTKLESEFENIIEIKINSGRPDDIHKQHYFHSQIVGYARKHNYYFNRDLPKSYIKFSIEFERKRYELVITMHHFSYDDSVIAIGAFLEYKGFQVDEGQNDGDSTIPLDIKPHTLSIHNDVTSKEQNIRSYLEHILTATIAQIASEI
ncbi:MAG: Fic family protein [Candidatus Kapabacteria bacterium]|jgi:Fic family protein|nr:Fic family protein [Candidatus Kapabacteria bacterium]